MTTPGRLAQDKWQSSGITNADAKKLRFKALGRTETGCLSPKFTGTCALFIPYFTASGKQTSFYRLRRLEAPTGFDALSGKVQRYAQPPGTSPEVYLPPLSKRSWKDIFADPKVPLLITEGELKAASATAAGFSCIGLGGVDSWQSKKKGITLVQALADAVWTGRAVIIVYDSDAATNPDVTRAAIGLASELRARGAEVRVASLPPDGDKKQGLDDFLVAKGRSALEKVSLILSLICVWLIPGN